MAVVQSSGIEWPGFLSREISTELAVTGFQLVGGVFGGVAALIASRKLEGVSQPLPLGRLVVPVGVAGLSTVIGALLLPSSL